MSIDQPVCFAHFLRNLPLNSLGELAKINSSLVAVQGITKSKLGGNWNALERLDWWWHELL